MAYQIKDDDVCSICLEELKNIEPNNIFITPCGHAFCSECIKKENQFSNNCPNCREILNKEYHDRQQEIQLEEVMALVRQHQVLCATYLGCV